MLLRDGVPIRLNEMITDKKELEKYRKRMTFTILDERWMRAPNGENGQPIWKTRKDAIPLTSKFIFPDGSEGNLTYCERMTPATLQKPQEVYPVMHMGLVQGSYIDVNAPIDGGGVRYDMDLSFYLQNSQWKEGNHIKYGISTAIYKEATAQQVAAKAIEEEKITTDARIRIMKELSMGQLTTLKNEVISAGTYNRFREDMDQDEIAFELVGFLAYPKTREFLLNAMQHLDNSFNAKVDLAIERGVLSFNPKVREWSLKENNKFRTLVKVSESQNKDAVIMGYFNNSSEEQRLLHKLIELTPAKEEVHA